MVGRIADPDSLVRLSGEAHCLRCSCRSDPVHSVDSILPSLPGQVDQEAAPRERTPLAPDPVDRRVLHDPSTHDKASTSECRKHRLPYGNENRRSQSQGDAGSSRLQFPQSLARMARRRAAAGPGTSPHDALGCSLMRSGPVAGATRRDPKRRKGLSCHLPVVWLDAYRPRTCTERLLAMLDASQETVSGRTWAARPDGCAGEQRPSATRNHGDCTEGPTRTAPGREGSCRTAETRTGGAARSGENNPPERITPCLLATVFTPCTLGNRRLAHDFTAPSSLGSAPVLGGFRLALLH